MKDSKKVLLLLALTQFNLQANPEIDKLIQERDLSSQRAERWLIQLRKIAKRIVQLQDEHEANQGLRKIQNQENRTAVSPKNLCFPLRPKQIKPTTETYCKTHTNSETIERNHILNNAENSFIALMDAYFSYCKRNYKDEQAKACTINEEIEHLKFEIVKQRKIDQMRSAADRQ